MGCTCNFSQGYKLRNSKLLGLHSIKVYYFYCKVFIRVALIASQEVEILEFDKDNFKIRAVGWVNILLNWTVSVDYPVHTCFGVNTFFIYIE